MASIIAPMDDELRARIDKFPWINWSEVAREEANKRRIFEDFLKTRRLSSEDERFCESIDWHPVDELPLKEEFVRKLKHSAGLPGKAMSTDEFRKWSDSL